MAMGLYTSSAGALELEYNIDYNLRSLNKSNFIRTELLSAETCTPRDYSDPIASPVEFLFCLGRESRQMSVSRQMSFLLISRSFHSELLQYNFLPLGPAAFGFCQGRSVPGRLPEITNKLATVSFYHKIYNI
ncbi:hypothetical protein V6N12_010459 [Hibiscus sabdariffa]|uniref:Uncharacterized protein n=1 Tax=Hibiscus sabdariffa TaxID=183260 RepID=A0ABR2EK54_9ROSI